MPTRFRRRRSYHAPISKHSKSASKAPLPEEQQEGVEEHLPLRSPVMYQVVRQEGEIELDRPLASLWWSGVSAGIAMFSSVMARGVLHEHLPVEHWWRLVEGFGYCFGFIIVVLGRLQLFTENTITAVLPLLANWSGDRLARTLRLWAVVLAANVVGTSLTATLATWTGMVPEVYLAAMLEVAGHFAANSPLKALLHGIPAGFLIAAIVWITPNAESATFSVVVWLTYLIGVGGLTHVIVGSAELALLLAHGSIGIGAALGVLLPTLVGNVVGGTGLFALLAYAQIKEEM
jgi:formate/nitrite transporter FocA (FNT family)